MRIIIIGNGIAGITAARTLRKLSDHSITVVSDETAYFFSRPALMYIYMGHMGLKETQPYEPHFWVKNRIELRQNRVVSINFEAKHLILNDNTLLPYDKLIIATGSKPNKMGWPGQEAVGVQGLYHLQDLAQLNAATERGITRGIVVGGGLIGVELAEMLASRGIPVTFLVREASFWQQILPAEESALINRHLVEHGIDLRLNTTLKAIHTDENGHATAVETTDGTRIDGNFVGLTVGVSPNIDFLKDSPLHIGRGILVDAQLQTNIPDVYAIGDCAEQTQVVAGRRPIEAIWYTGRMMGESVARAICGEDVRYNPGIWFNSAKFFDIEYQVYGHITPNLDPDHDTLYWETLCGKKSIRLVYHRFTGAVLGFNLMGIRYRHEVCEKWLKQGAHIENVLENLLLANFDPEFFTTYESALLAIYAEKTGKKLKLQAQRRLSAVTHFLKSPFKIL